MLEEIIAVAKSAVTRGLRAVGRVIKRHLAPESALVVAGAVHDIGRSKSELLAENAMLRQQLIVACRAVKRPSLRNGDRLLMVLLARLNQAWRASLHLVQPNTLLREHASRRVVHFNVTRSPWDSE